MKALWVVDAWWGLPLAECGEEPHPGPGELGEAGSRSSTASP